MKISLKRCTISLALISFAIMMLQDPLFAEEAIEQPAEDRGMRPKDFTRVYYENEMAVVNLSPSQSLQKGVTDHFRELFDAGDPFSFIGNIVVFSVSLPFFLAGSAMKFALNPFAGPPERVGLGSGFIIDESGYILTNLHVIKGADKITVRFSEDEIFEARLIGLDEETDIALLKIDQSPGKGDFQSVTLGDSNEVEVGQWVMTMGFPYGLPRTATVGIVSSTGRDLGLGPYDDFIQIDAAINPGSSGGPLFDADGHVIGMNTSKYSKGESIGFSIPINMARAIIEDLKSEGKAARGWLGLSVEKISTSSTERYGLKLEKGLVVTSVFEGGPSAQAGIEEGDVIFEVNGRPVTVKKDLLRIMATAKVGADLEIKLDRKGEEKIFHVAIGPREEN